MESVHPIVLRTGNVGGKEYLFIEIANDGDFMGNLRRIKARWSREFQSWYIGIDDYPIYKLRGIFHPAPLMLDELSAELREASDLPSGHRQSLRKFERYLAGARYSASTISTYVGWLSEFLFFHRFFTLDGLTMKEVHRFNSDFILKRGYSISSQRQFIGAIKLFFTHIAESGINPEALERPHKDHKLPLVLNKEEVTAVLTVTENLKHKCILATIYSCGLRVGELLNLRLTDIDGSRMLVHVRMSKGRKDRYVRLGKSNLALLRSYYRAYRPRELLFEGPGGKAYSASSIRKILHRSCAIAGIGKSVTPHTLRHSYATHLLELGVDIRYIQAMLGHRRPETTMIYTHISTHKIQDLPNPLDEIVRDELSSHRDMWNDIPHKNPLIPKRGSGY